MKHAGINKVVALRHKAMYPTDAAGLVLHLPFWLYGSEQSKIWDISGCGNHGTITGITPALIPILGPNLVSNWSMETGTDGEELISNGTIDRNTTGWVGVGAETVTRETTIIHGGAGSLKVVTSAQFGGVNTVTAGLVAGTVYKLDLYVFGNGTDNLLIDLVGVHKGGNYNLNSAVIPAAWTHVQTVFTATHTEHAGGDATLRIFQNGSYSAPFIFYIDDLSLQAVSIPTGWTGIFSPEFSDRSKVQKHTGNFSLHISDSTPSYGGASSTTFSVTAGDRYRVSTWYYSIAALVGIGQIFAFNGDGSFSWGYKDFGVQGEWAYADVFDSPTVSGSQAKVILANSSNASAAEFYFDDVEVRKVLGYESLGWQFDGSNDLITIPSLNLGTTHTLNFWLTSQNYSGVVMGGDSNYHGLILTDTTVGYNAGATAITVSHKGWRSLDKTLITIVRSGTSVSFYQDGIQIGSTQTLDANHDLTVATIGNYTGGTSWFKGVLFSLIASTRAFSDSEVKTYYDLTKSRYGSVFTTDILFVGDSKTNLNLWQSALLANLNGKYPYEYFNISTIAGDGESIASYSLDLDASMATLTVTPKYVLVDLGTNDGDFTDTEAQYKAIVDSIHSRFPSAHIYITTPWKQGWDSEADDLADIITTVVSDRSSFVSLGDDERVWYKGSDTGVTNTYDGTHPNTVGGINGAAQRQTILGL